MKEYKFADIRGKYGGIMIFLQNMRCVMSMGNKMRHNENIGIVKALASGFSAAQTGSCTKLLNKVRSDYRLLQKKWQGLCKMRTSQADVEFSEVSEWLYNNFYIIEKEYGLCKKELQRTPALPCIDGIPRICGAVHAFCKLSDTPLYDSDCNAVLSALEEAFGLSLSEYFAAPALFRAALIIRATEIVSKYISLKESEKRSQKEKYARLFGNAITSMKYVSYHDFDADAQNSKPAKILALDPSGEFSSMTESTKTLYLHLLCAKAKKLGISENEYAEMLLSKAEAATGNRRHIGYPLFERSLFYKYTYFISIIGTAAVITILLLFISPLCLFALFPIWEAVKLLTHSIFSRLVKSIPLPKKELSEIPDNAPVLVVITSLLLGEKSDSELFDRLCCHYLSNGGKNIYFGILADLCDSKSATNAGDEATVDYAYGRIDALTRKYGKNFLLFERRRSYSKSEEAFMGWERKRGAILELVRFLKGGNTTFTTRSKAMAQELLGDVKIKYVVTLDADTNLPIDAVKDMCACMLHPLANPVINEETGIVTDGYGVMQPRCTTDLASASKTPFSRLFCGVGGADPCLGAAFDVYQSIFGKAFFCGKGIFDVDAFASVIDKHCTFPEDTILSHASLEGAKLRCALISDIEFTDSFPKHELSYHKRRHRQIRGDIQNLAYLLPKIKFGKNDVRKNTLSALSRFKLFDNARSAAVPCFAFLCVFLSAFVSTPVRLALLFSSLAYIYLPFILDVLSMIFSRTFQCAARRFFSKGVSTGIWQSFLRMLFSLSALSIAAFSFADAISKSLYRLFISGKNLLEWQSAVQSDAGDGSLVMFVHKNIFSAFAGFLLFAFAPAGFLRGLSVLWLAFPVISYHTSFDKKEENTSNDTETEKKLREYAKDIWGFFADNVNVDENHLPPDNIGQPPHAAAAHRTSPTNIGLYLLSVLAARDFTFIDTAEMKTRIENTISILEKLPMWHGHFYSRYDTKKLTVLSPGYISTFDSGTLTACLITLKEGLREYIYESTALLELIPRIEKLLENTDYKILYNKKRNLFSLGAKIHSDGEYETDENCYDLLMNKARTISYIECAKRNVPKKHWSSLSRALVTSGGYIGLYSHGGTAFEYFMPPIFLPERKGSLCAEALLFALKAQMSKRVRVGTRSIWGISESGYYSFDSEKIYRCKDFGIPLLSLKNAPKHELVISPYSSFLAMCVGKHKALANLSQLSKLGYYGKYGFYEAIDFTPGRSTENGSVIKSYMSHHLGMSLAALCNAAFDGILRKRFMSDSTMACGRELLEEKIPVNASIPKASKLL